MGPPRGLVGQLLGGAYRISGVLAEGGMGIVYVAEHVRLKRQVAVKVLAGHVASNAIALERFTREAEVIAQLQHPHVVSVLDFDRTENDEPYLVMELLQGESLAERLSRVRAVPSMVAVSVAEQVASALAAAHERGIVHRDLKPANVFLVDMPQQEVFVKLLDFGISKLTTAARGLTAQFDVIGTPEYMSPEQACGKTALVDARGDQYSLGVLTYEMLAGRVPFVADELAQLLHQVITQPAPRLSELAPALPAALDPVLARALAKEPDARYPSIAEFADALLSAVGLERSAVGLTSSDSPAPQRSDQKDTAVPTAGATSYSVQSEDRPSMVREKRGGDEHTLARSGLCPRQDSGLEGSWNQLGSRVLTQRLFVDPAAMTDASLTAKEAFLLSRIDNGATIEEVLDLSPLPREETLSLLAGLAERGLIESAA
jgi:serine/threonine protein kinase